MLAAKAIAKILVPNGINASVGKRTASKTSLNAFLDTLKKSFLRAKVGNVQKQADSAAEKKSAARNVGFLLKPAVPKAAQREVSPTVKQKQENGDKRLKQTPHDLPAASLAIQWKPNADASKQAAPKRPVEQENASIETVGVRHEKSKAGAPLTVVDMRVKISREVKADKKAETRGQAVDPQTNSADIEALRLGSGGEAPSEKPLQSVKENAVQQPNDFGRALSEKLREGASDIVRAAHIVLRDGDVGFIRLRLEPQTLGGVKIELKMAEKQISGKIIVESDLACEAFRSSLDALKDAFAESGLETRSLEVEVRNGMSSGSQGGGRSASERGEPYFSRALIEMDNAVPKALQGFTGGSALNMLA